HPHPHPRPRHPRQQEIRRRLREALQPPHLPLLRGGLHGRALLPRCAQGHQRRGGGPGEICRRPPQGGSERRSPRAHEDGRPRQPEPERLHPQGGAGGGQAPEHRDLHLSERLAVLDVQPRGVSQNARVRSQLPALQVLRVSAMLRAALCWALVLLATSARANSPSPYAGQEVREIKALSPEEISDYLSGKGMGLAKAAELNGYPRPAHVLELAAQLGLTPEQRAATEALFQKMQERAMVLGRELVEAEGTLDRLFASHSASSEAVKVSLTRIARLQGELRQVHLDAHIAQAAVLTAAQITTYARLRGYDAGPAHDGPHHRH